LVRSGFMVTTAKFIVEQNVERSPHLEHQV
jgi:hypothetical protein